MRSPKPIQQLSWSDRFTIIEAAKAELLEVTEEDILRIFAVDKDDYETASECLADGVFKVNNRIDAAFYIPYFRGETPVYPELEPRTRTLPVPEEFDPEKRQLFASKNKKPAGRKGNNIQRAFAAIPSTPTPAEEFAKKHQVSMAVLRQYKRFDKEGKGQVNVRKDKELGVVMIWRSEDASN